MSAPKIEKLTPSQEAVMPVYLQKWRKIAFSTERIDRDQATEAVKAAYNLIGKQAPFVLFFDSPDTALRELETKLENELWTSQLPDFNELWIILYNLIDKQLNDQLLDLDVYQIKNALKFKLKVPSYYYNNPEWWAINSCLIDFCLNVLNCDGDQKQWKTLQLLIENCGWMFPYEKICYVCDRPIKLAFDRQQRLHAEGEPAIEFADGFSLYAYRGVRLPKKYEKLHPNQWQPKWVLEEDNAELRRVLIQGIGYARLYQQLQGIELDSWQEYTLLKIDNNIDEEAVHLLKMTCPSTAHIHVLRVPPDITSAREAIRWVNWGIDPDEFYVQT
jgi:hypothetical protein